jgi:hypothetical protein
MSEKITISLGPKERESINAIKKSSLLRKEKIYTTGGALLWSLEIATRVLKTAEELMDKRRSGASGIDLGQYQSAFDTEGIKPGPSPSPKIKISLALEESGTKAESVAFDLGLPT